MLFRSYRKRKALESYRHVLGPRLRATWGRREQYSPEEVVVTAATYHLSETFLCYALAMYCDRESFDRYHLERGETCSYVKLWHELSAVTVSDGSMNLSAMRAANDRESNAADTADALTETGSSHDAGVDAGGFVDGGGFGGDGGGGGD
jgi:hypothetical protein